MPTPAPEGHDAAPRPARVSSLSLLSLLFSILPCVGSLPAIFLGAFALYDLSGSGSKQRGRGVAIAGLVLGIVNLLAVAIVGPMLWVGAPSPSTPAASPVMPPPGAPGPTAVLPPGITPTPGPRGADEGGQMTTLNEVVETKVGTTTVVDIPPSVRSLPDELEAQQLKAQRAKEKLVVFTVSEGCRPCLSVAAVMNDPKMQAALDHVRLVRVDVHDMGPELEDIGIQTRKIPGFYLLGPGPSAIDGITGAEWDDDTADNAAPVLGAFVRGKLTRRREKREVLPHVPGRPRGIPRPAPTLL